MGHRAYYLDETQKGWNVYYSQWGARDLFHDKMRGDSLPMMAGMEEIDGEYQIDPAVNPRTEELNTDEPFEDLVMKYSHEEALFIRHLGQEDYTGYRPITIMPYEPMTELTHYIRETNTLLSFFNTILALEKMVEPKKETTQLTYLLFDEVLSLIYSFTQEYRILIPVKTNGDAKAFEWLNEYVRSGLDGESVFDAVIKHKGTSHPLLDSMQERYEELHKSFEATGYTIKQVYESACEHWAKMIDIRAEYLFWKIIYPLQMRTIQNIPSINTLNPNTDRGEELTTLIPSFSPVAGIDIEDDYGIVNAPYISDSVFISPLSRGGAKTMMNQVWDRIETKLRKPHNSLPTILISELKKQNLWV